MGMIVSVYKNPLGDCTNHGVSGRKDKLTVVNAEGPFSPSSDAPAVKLERTRQGILRIVPVVREGDPEPWFMMGGNFAHTSDSRFSEACERVLGAKFYGAVAIHDRVE